MDKNTKFVLALFMFLVLLSLCVFLMTMANQPDIIKVENIFADVNGDGVLDIIVKGDVILNTSSQNF